MIRGNRFCEIIALESVKIIAFGLAVVMSSSDTGPRPRRPRDGESYTLNDCVQFCAHLRSVLNKRNLRTTLRTNLYAAVHIFVRNCLYIGAQNAFV